MKLQSAIRITAVTNSHLPDYAEYDVVAEGMTVRQTVSALRCVGSSNYGDLGTLSAVLDDGTSIEVRLRAAYGGGQLLGTQQIERREQMTDRLIRVYPW